MAKTTAAQRSYAATKFQSSDGWGLLPHFYPIVFGIGAVVGVLGFTLAAVMQESLFNWVNGIGSALFVGSLFTFLALRGGNRTRKRNVSKVSEHVNATILEITGDASQKLTEDQVQAIMKSRSVETVAVNGVSGVEVSATEVSSAYSDSDRAITFQYKEPDNGLESFDLLVQAAAKKNPEIESVIGSYRGKS